MIKNFIEYKNLIPVDLVNKIEKMMTSENFPWYYQETTVNDESDYFKNIKNKKFKINDTGQFTHIFLNSEKINSPFFEEIFNILKIFSLKEKINLTLLRCKANLQIQKSKIFKNKYNIPHIDIQEEHMVLIYYVNDSDGDTLLFDKNLKIFKKIKPEKGKFLLFNGNILHASSFPVKNKKRIIINLDLKIKYE